jgi:hypothetical protein
MVNADIKATSIARFIFLSIRRWTTEGAGEEDIILPRSASSGAHFRP